MGDTTDGSSKAAQSAQPRPSAPARPAGQAASHHRPGFFRRIFGAREAAMTGVSAPENHPVNGGSAPVLPGMVNLRRMVVEDVMVPKADIVSVPATITKNDLVEVFRESGLTRIPVYKDTLDTPIGMAHLKDFALQYGFGASDAGRFALRKMLRPLLFVPPSMPIGVLLSKMQQDRRHLALVIDEYGGVDGLVTIEDLIEQVIGEIEDEHDTEEDQLFSQQADGTWLAQAKTPLDEFEAAVGLALTAHEEVDEEEIDTLGGLVFMLSGRVPVRGEMIRHPDGVEFEVIEADPRRIKRLRVRLPQGLGGAKDARPPEAAGETAPNATPAVELAQTPAVDKA
ncbi:hemolysin family protein [Rhodalgimonas zhirmunskyi]|uniref:Hemolysin family protein n=1 Tax=Rhodalgimonas zhirmunskyi TaxID=2964767 RepID=A0AAJ1UEM5_9RHOB|nr:hemolysin family protein [Rhodoalgimonas zhirmunskyi]MDQ2094577.1 hemolysin family protein [Rhodoalgimonas zhirmunskyi]